MAQSRASEILAELDTLGIICPPKIVVKLPSSVADAPQRVRVGIDRFLECLDNFSEMVQDLRSELLEVRDLLEDRAEDVNPVAELAGPGDDDAEVPKAS